MAVFTFGRRRAVQRDELCHHQRTQEFGVRIAPGASRIEVLQLVTRDGVLLTLPGLFLGIAVAIVTLQFFASILVGVSPTDPLTFAGAALFPHRRVCPGELFAGQARTADRSHDCAEVFVNLRA